MSEEQLPSSAAEPSETNGPEETQASSGEQEKGRMFGMHLAAVKCMVSFFTVIRLDVGQSEFDAMERKFWLVPVLGFINGLLALVVCLILGYCGVGLLGQAVAALGSMYVFSKFLHFDGLTDFGDGIIVSSGDREKHVRALKDSLIGAGGFGVALLVVLFTIAMYYELGSDIACIDTVRGEYRSLGIGMLAFCVEILVKNAQVAAAAFGEPGNGMASRQVRCTTSGSLAKSTVLTAVLLAVATSVCIAIGSVADIHTEIGFGPFVFMFLSSVVLSVAVGYYMARKANGIFGFVNGDILGATNEISRAVILFAMVLICGLVL